MTSRADTLPRRSGMSRPAGPKSARSRCPRPARMRCVFARCYGAISRGTEALVFAGRVPASEHERMRAPFMGGRFPFPVKYGYAAVGGSKRDRRNCRADPCSRSSAPDPVRRPGRRCGRRLPDDVPPRRAVLAANMETALNAVWDAAPGRPTASRSSGPASSGADRLSVRAAAGRRGDAGRHQSGRAELAEPLGVGFASPEAAPADCDLVVHASAHRGRSRHGAAARRRGGDRGRS